MSTSTEAEVIMLEEERDNLSDSDLDHARMAEIFEELEILRKQRLADEWAEEVRYEKQIEDRRDEAEAREENSDDPCDDGAADYYEHGSH